MSNDSEPQKAIIVIPARLESTRLPRKLLLQETGKSLIQHTYESACQSQLAQKVLVATDHREIADAVVAFGGQAVMTRADHPSGTSRIAEVASELTDFQWVVNVQGDEPEISGEAIDRSIELLQANPTAQVATLATPIRDRKSLDASSVVKVVTDRNGNALYFSRSPIPCARDWDDSLLHAEPATFLQHIGLYAYRRDFLRQYVQLSPAVYEKVESLEQLRILDAGYEIQVGIVDHHAAGIDTAEDYQAFVRRMER